jgi:hypothetical protein
MDGNQLFQGVLEEHESSRGKKIAKTCQIHGSYKNSHATWMIITRREG